MANQIRLEECIEVALDVLITCCIDRLKDEHNIHTVCYPADSIQYESECIGRKIRCGCKVDKVPIWKECYSKSVCPPEPSSGNLYALHTRSCSNSDWRIRYVGKATDDICDRFSQHLVTTKGASSKLWRVAHEVSKGHQIGVSWIDVAAGQPEVAGALVAYVEMLIISRESLRTKDNHGGWNERVG